MHLVIALRHAVSRNGGTGQALGSNGVAVRFVGTIEINDEGPRRRQIGPVVVSPDLASPFLDAIQRGDEAGAAEEFQDAFALSYGVGYVTISDVSQLEIVEVSRSRPRSFHPG